MQTILFKLAVIFLVLFAVVLLSGNHLNSFYSRFGDAEHIHSVLLLVFLFVGLGTMALVFIRTVLGLLLVICLALAGYLIYHYQLFAFLK